MPKAHVVVKAADKEFLTVGDNASLSKSTLFSLSLFFSLSVSLRLSFALSLSLSFCLLLSATKPPYQNYLSTLLFQAFVTSAFLFHHDYSLRLKIASILCPNNLTIILAQPQARNDMLTPRIPPGRLRAGRNSTVLFTERGACSLYCIFYFHGQQHCLNQN
jgi:hypothetical protein